MEYNPEYYWQVDQNTRNVFDYWNRHWAMNAPWYGCEGGFYDDYTNETCYTCSAGYYCEAGINIDPVECPLDHYCEEGVAAPVVCPKDTPTESTGSTCIKDCLGAYGCAAGQYKLDDECLLCQPGYYSHEYTWDECIICEIGTYCPYEGMTEPILCDTGMSTLYESSIDVSECLVC